MDTSSIPLAEPFGSALYVTALGLGATAVMDLWGLVQARAFGAPQPNYRLLGRWIEHLGRGRFAHASIGSATAVRGELALGWAAHYGVGMAFAVLHLAIWGAGWAGSPSLLPALLTGWATLAAPFLIMQPAFGLGLAASRTPDPLAARLRSLITHSVFGFGLYLSACALSPLPLTLPRT